MSERRASLRGEITGGESVVKLDEYWVPPTACFEVQGGDEPDVLFRVRVENGEPYLAEVRLLAQSATSQIIDADLKMLMGQRVEDWVKWIVANTAAFSVGPDGDIGERLDGSLSESYIELRAAASRARKRAHGTRRASDDAERLKRVAQVYRDGGARGSQAVAEAFEVQLRTAQLYVKQAREAHLLGPALRGKAGER